MMKLLKTFKYEIPAWRRWKKMNCRGGLQKWVSSKKDEDTPKKVGF